METIRKRALSRPISHAAKLKRACRWPFTFVVRRPWLVTFQREIEADRSGPLHRVRSLGWMPIIWSCVLADVRGIRMQRTQEQYPDDYRGNLRGAIFRTDHGRGACHYAHALLRIHPLRMLRCANAQCACSVARMPSAHARLRGPISGNTHRSFLCFFPIEMWMRITFVYKTL